MNVLAPVSSIMTKDLITVNPSDKLKDVWEIFSNHKIHHIPVVRYKELVGIISKSDVLYFLKGLGDDTSQDLMNEVRLNNYSAESIMTTGFAKLEPDDRINVALDVFGVNLFHALPVVEGKELVGILTPFDIIKALAEEGVTQ